jgi:hypothetical protein
MVELPKFVIRRIACSKKNYSYHLSKEIAWGNQLLTLAKV